MGSCVGPNEKLEVSEHCRETMLMFENWLEREISLTFVTIVVMSLITVSVILEIVGKTVWLSEAAGLVIGEEDIICFDRVLWCVFYVNGNIKRNKSHVSKIHNFYKLVIVCYEN